MTGTMLTTTEAAEVIGVVPGTLSVWRSRNKGPAYHKTGGTIKYTHADIAAWIEESRVEPAKNAQQ